MAPGLGLWSIGLIKNHSIYTAQWSLCTTFINSPTCLFSYFPLSIPLLIVNESNAIKMYDRDQQSREKGDSGALSVFSQPCPFLFPQLLHLTISPSYLNFTLSCCTVLLKLPRWPLYLRHWSAHTFVPRKVVFVGRPQVCIHTNHKHTVRKTDRVLLSQWHLFNDVRTFSQYTPWCNLLYMQQGFPFFRGSCIVTLCCGIFQGNKRKKVLAFVMMRLQTVTITDDKVSLVQNCNSWEPVGNI